MAEFNSIGKIGLWTSIRLWPKDLVECAEVGTEIEGLGFSSMWIGGSTGQLETIDAILNGTNRLIAGTGITQIWFNSAQAIAQQHHHLTSSYPGRFLLGLGVGHAPAVEASGQKYERPLSKLNSYLDELDHAEQPVPISERVIAALRPKALAIAAARAAGAFPCNVPSDHTAKARMLLGPSALLIPEQKVFFSTSATESREVGRRAMSYYLGLANYLNNLRELGFDDADFTDGGSDRLIDAMVAWGSADTVAARVREHIDAGADQVAVQVLSKSTIDELPRAEWHQAADALID